MRNTGVVVIWLLAFTTFAEAEEVTCFGRSVEVGRSYTFCVTGSFSVWGDSRSETTAPYPDVVQVILKPSNRCSDDPSYTAPPGGMPTIVMMGKPDFVCATLAFEWQKLLRDEWDRRKRSR
jgi:hypothetical protein